MKFRKRPAVIAVAALTATTLVACSSDDADGDASYPDRDLRIIVPYDAGGASDLAARTLAGEMEESLGVSIIDFPEPVGVETMTCEPVVISSSASSWWG